MVSMFESRLHWLDRMLLNPAYEMYLYVSLETE